MWSVVILVKKQFRMAKLNHIVVREKDNVCLHSGHDYQRGRRRILNEIRDKK